ncbi:type VII secretion protein EccB [Mycobacterium rhizamassiliense]|uniref:type VII secretion protein EccB n=1 Tax=Mycobacterium rhizamassiliense TaxID=1841860 RepID=UPI00097D6E7E|nr:type VII secretion protein EccB [Mycobacterium rhizamassiliense]
MPRQLTIWLYVSGNRFLLRRAESALLGLGTRVPALPLRARTAPLTIGCVVAAVAVAAIACLGLLQPEARLGQAQIVMGKQTGALYVRVGDTWHPVLNLASARLIAGTHADPRPVRESELRHTKRGPLLGIPGVPDLSGPLLSGEEAVWTICDAGDNSATTVIVESAAASSGGRISSEQAILATAGLGSPTYLLYNGQRAVVDMTDPAVVRALRLEGSTPRTLSPLLLNALPEVSPIAAPRIRGAGENAAGLPGYPVGSVLRIARGDSDEYYAVLATGIQRIGRIAADLLRFRDSHGSAEIPAVTPDVLRTAPTVGALPVATFPDQPPRSLVGGDWVVCVTWSRGQSGSVLRAVDELPVASPAAPVRLAQADARGPALDAVYLPPGRSAYVSGPAGTRYLVADTGVRFAVHDDETARDLGLLAAAIPIPPRVLAALPSGPELSRADASIARDGVTGAPSPAR